MNLNPIYQGQHIGVFGLARSGAAAFDALERVGARVVGFDDRPEMLDSDTCVDWRDYPLGDLDLLVLSPGVPLTHPKPHAIIEKASQAGVPICGDFDLFVASRKQLPRHRLVGITGTNGKSTTTALIAHMAASVGRPACAFGNIGVPFLGVEPLAENGVYVAELSSFQLDLSPEPITDIAILLNLSPDHLDRHGTMENYAAAKAKLFGLTRPKLAAIISVDDPHCRAIARTLQRRIIPISTLGPIKGGVWISNGFLVDGIKNAGMQVGSLEDLSTLRGQHNYQNALAAYAAARELGLGRDEAFDALKSFKGLEHRQELVSTRNGITIINDSKATNWDSARRGLNTFDNIRWIAGGRVKGGMDPIDARSLDNVCRAYLYGEAGPAIEATINDRVKAHCFSALEEATYAALGDAQQGDTLLLSPAATAFDQFSDFEMRGQAFKRYVRDWYAATQERAS